MVRVWVTDNFLRHSLLVKYLVSMYIKYFKVGVDGVRCCESTLSTNTRDGCDVSKNQSRSAFCETLRPAHLLTNNHDSFKVTSIPSTPHSDAQFKQQQVVFITYTVHA